MELKPVESSNIKAVGYDEASRSLYVEFHRGRLYRYLDVPAEVYAEFLAAPSLGKYLHEHIKPNYKFEKVEEVIMAKERRHTHCRFTLTELKGMDTENVTIGLMAVYDQNDPSDRKFNEYTPWGELRANIQNKAVLPMFNRLGKKFRVIIEEIAPEGEEIAPEGEEIAPEGEEIAPEAA